MTKSILLLAVFGIVAVSTAWGQIPPGYEVVHITDNPNDYSNRPQINICGEVVFSTRINQSEFAEEIFLYDNGKLTMLTRDSIRDAFADINDAGTIVWTQNADGWGGGEVVMLKGEELTVLGVGSSPEMNNLGHVAWKLFNPTGCASPSDIFFFNGKTVEQITNDGFSNQSVEINDYDELVWTRYDFCADPWESDIMLYSGGLTTQLTDGQHDPQMGDINNLGQVAWRSWYGPGQDQIEHWEDGETVVLTEWGYNPRFNDVGDMFFIRWHDDTSTWQAWLCRGCVGDGTGEPIFLQLTDDPHWNTDGCINDYGEVAWQAKNYPESEIYFMRRTRDGDVDLNEHVDLDDFASLQGCLTGPGDTGRLCDCRFVDLDHDRDIDLRDFSTFQNLFTADE